MPQDAHAATCPHCGLVQALATYCARCRVHIQQYDAVQQHLSRFESGLRRARELADTGRAGSTEADEALRTLAEAYQGLRAGFQDITRLTREMATLVEVGKAINSILAMDQLLDTIMDMAVKAMNAERGLLMLKDEQTGKLAVQAARHLDALAAGGEAWQVSSNVISRVASEGRPILATDASREGAFREMQSVIAHHVRSLLCVPLQSKTAGILGVIYLDNRVTSGAFTEQSVEFLTAFAHQAAVAIENARLYENVRKETTARMNLQRYLPPSVAEDALKREGSAILGGRRTECSVLFGDICGFTAVAQRLEPDRVVRHLNEFFGVMTEIVFRHQGTMLEFLGDAVLAVFGTPVPCADHARRALAAAADMQRATAGLAERAEREGWPQFRIRIGVNSGEVVAGNIGSQSRVKYTVIGDTVNLAARLQTHAKPGGILLSESAYEPVKDLVRAVKWPPLEVKGRAGAVDAYEVLELLDRPAPAGGADQRRSARREVSLFTIYRNPTRSQVFQGTVKNISRGGVQLSTRDDFEPGARLLLSFRLPSGEKLSDVEGRVVRVERVTDERGAVYFKLGIRFAEGAAPPDTAT